MYQLKRITITVFCTDDLRLKIEQLKQNKNKPFAVIGVAGTTETGNIDPLRDIAEVCAESDCHFHVDAAWGGATLMSNNHRHLLDGIELADSVTIDAHKQLYIPMGAGMVLFKKPDAMTAIEHHAQYILRKGSKDLGSHTLGRLSLRYGDAGLCCNAHHQPSRL